MTTKILEGVKYQKIGNAPVVVLPLRMWQELEEHFEELELASSVALRKKIAKARSEKKLYSRAQAMKALGL